MAVGCWGMALRHVGTDASLYRPAEISLLPFIAGVMMAICLMGWQDFRHGI